MRSGHPAATCSASRANSPAQFPGNPAARATVVQFVALARNLTGSRLKNGGTVMRQIVAGDVAWVLVSTVLVLLMTVPGLALFYAGMVRKKNVLAIMMQSFSLCAAMTIVWMVAGYSIAFTNGIGATQRLHGRFVPDLARWPGARLGQGVHPRRRIGQSAADHHPGERVRDVPDGVRHHHPGAVVTGSSRRPHESSPRC